MIVFLPLILVNVARPPAPVLKRSDVAFMYQADKETYRAYGATVLAWGGAPTPKALAEAEGVRWFGSVGMVTEFAAYYERFPDTYEQGLCRDIHGKPVKVPWLTDHSHKGIPYWWCCTRQPNTRTFLRERVVQTIKAGAQGLHVDDHLGTAGGLWLGICFCDRCVEGFRAHLAGLPASRLAELGVSDPAAYDFRKAAQEWLAAQPGRNVTAHPLWREWSVYQYRGAAEFMLELRKLAVETAGRPVPVGANAGLLWPGHLADYQALDLFTAETDHHASERKLPDAPVTAYRLAEALGRPYAATASGWDWAYVKEHNLPGLVRGWIALSYAAGQRLMAPHHQWCYTPEKGTHWYDGPAERFAPLYRFVRANADLFDGYETHADLGVVIPHRSYMRDAARWIGMCSELTRANVSFRILLAADDIVRKPLTDRELASCRVLLAPERSALNPDDSRRLDARAAKGGLVTTVDEALKSVKPAVQVEAPGAVRVFPRKTGRSAVVHLVNFAYDADRDDVTPQRNVRVTIDLRALGVRGARSCRLVRPEAPDATLRIVNGAVTVPELGLWAIVQVK